MLFALSDLCWRAVALLWLAIAPYAGPIDVAASSTTIGASLRLGAAALMLGLMAFGLLRLARFSRMGAVLGGFALLAALGLGTFFSGDRGPLARGLVWIGPLAWSAIAVTLAGPVVDLTAAHQNRPPPRASERATWALVVVLLGALSVASAWRRVGSQTALLRAALRNNPGQESAAVQLAGILERAGTTDQAADVLRACAAVNPGACHCAVATLKRGLERGAYVETGAILKQLGRNCQELQGVYGMLAETLAGSGYMGQAEQAADIALAKNRGDPYALYAKAMVRLNAGDYAAARHTIEQSIASDRGPRARLLLGLVLYRAGDIDAAKAVFERIVGDNPKDATALYDLALIDQVQKRHDRARQGYLRVLALDPKHLDARYNLGVLAHEAGIAAELKDHLRELEKVAPAGDERVARLRGLVSE
jgi:tetratricopeptide (TPR) repeat protein